MFFQLLWLRSFDSSKCLKFPNLIIENIVQESDTKDVKSFCLEKLIVYKCDRQKSILPSSVLFKASTSLRILNISSCHKLEQFFANKNEGYAPIEIAFTKLEELINNGRLTMAHKLLQGNLQFQLSITTNNTCDQMPHDEDIFGSWKPNHNRTT